MYILLFTSSVYNNPNLTTAVSSSRDLPRLKLHKLHNVKTCIEWFMMFTLPSILISINQLSVSPPCSV